MKHIYQLSILITGIFFALVSVNNSANAQCTKPSGVNAGAITTTSAMISWNSAAGALSYRVRWRVSGTTAWTG
ncbi:MAG: fibronectin type III domain-containing protein, partial [Bacteroidota bacterium]